MGGSVWLLGRLERFSGFVNPVEDEREAEFLPFHGAHDKLVAFDGSDIDVETVEAQAAGGAQTAGPALSGWRRQLFVARSATASGGDSLQSVQVCVPG